MKPSTGRKKNEANSANGTDAGEQGVLILTILFGVLVLFAAFIPYPEEIEYHLILKHKLGL